ncbi:exosome complex protein Rrp42 [Candidatus Woesearchaeota archaeon]|nr:exosome complex protein Rrp42 [Candidatus Woesearchaeota archaeon]MBT3538133.1 exosome complex protein Rrp42 [Candidatus Woesearchaeota archaeon]MBT4697508.1 exosome complex protein Rrp42 [Candidatus Woesearchaeota archaeon]MBT4716848.1 exosome complex protein Rrp42 [Candidatus Woesearchaeota archaeon]MBT7105802.1 exosome complex protein Rrp42 [Candidatus Woesearchaeota archaeon]
MMSESRKHITEYLKKGLRLDGRKLDEFREVSVEYGVSKNAEGSARVKIGGTEVIAGVKLNIGTPYSDRPDEGTLMVGVELYPLASPEFEAGPPSIDSIELARVVDRGIREAGAIDNKALCIEKGEKIWIVSVDICPINDEGNLFDAAGLAAIAAIMDAKFPKVEKDGTVNYKERTKTPLPIKKRPIPITVWRIGNDLIVDPINEEEKSTDARLTIASLSDGVICALQKGGDATLTVEDVDKMTDLAIAKAKDLRSKLGGKSK